VETRSSLQCRTHHQKVLEKYKEIKKIVTSFKRLIGTAIYEERLSQVKTTEKLCGLTLHDSKDSQ
jgi:hypothetical protein